MRCPQPPEYAGSSACSQRRLLPVVEQAIPALIPVGAPFVGYPASSPLVTAVGGTAMRLDARNRLASQRPWNETDYGIAALRFGQIEGIPVARFSAGAGTGGVSRLYRQPFYQEAAGLRSGRRTVPDVSMHADSLPGVAIYCTAWDAATGTGPCPPNPVTGTGWNPVGGTSFASPLLAGGIALANQYAKSRGAPRVGFVNPLLYRPATRRAHVFNDVRQGTNAILPIGCCSAGPATTRRPAGAPSTSRAWPAPPRRRGTPGPAAERPQRMKRLRRRSA
jgi:hypothetical protein